MDEDYIAEPSDRTYKPSKKYIKITNDVKKNLLNSIIERHMSIKQVKLCLFLGSRIAGHELHER